MTALHDADELSCPRCGVILDDIEIPDAEVVAANEEYRVALECPDCGSDLELVVASAAATALGVETWVEDRRVDEA